jgi:myosin protein heavy chain
VVVDTAARARKAIQDTKESATHREGALQTTVTHLEVQIGDIQQNHDISIRNLLQQQEELETRLKNYGTMDIDNGKQVAELKLQHAEAIASLQQRLVDGEGALKDLQIRHKSAEVDHQIALEDATLLITELQHQLEMTKRCIEDLEVSQSKFHLSEQERVAELERELKQASQDYRAVLQASDAIEKEKSGLENMLEKIKGDHECLMANVRDEYLESQRNKENRLQTLQKEVEENVRLLDMAKAEAAHLTLRLQEEMEGRIMDREEYDQALQSMNQQSEQLKEQLHGMQRDLLDLQSRVQLAECQVTTTEDEKTGLQQDITTLGAEIQKLKSINRYLEAQSKER